MCSDKLSAFHRRIDVENVYNLAREEALKEIDDKYEKLPSLANKPNPNGSHFFHINSEEIRRHQKLEEQMHAIQFSSARGNNLLPPNLAKERKALIDENQRLENEIHRILDNHRLDSLTLPLFN